MPNDIEVNITTKVSGLADVTSLKNALKQLKDQSMKYGEVKKRVNAQTKIDIEMLKQDNQMLKAKSRLSDTNVRNLAKQTNLQDDYNHSINERMSVEQDALRTSKMVFGNTSKESMESSRIMVRENRKIIQSELEVAAATRIRTQALMRASISMFVLNISMGQLVQSMKPFTKGNEDAEKAVDDLSGALQFSMAPLQAYMSLQMISTSLAQSQKVAFMGVATSLGAIFFLYQAITAKTASMRAAYAAIATVLTAVAVASWMVNFGLATTKGLLGDITGIALVVGALAAMAGAVAFVSAPRAQTEPGQMKKFKKGGLAEVHAGEVWRPPAGGGMGGNEIKIYLPKGYRGTVGETRQFAKDIDRLINGGHSSSNYSKVVIADG